MNKEEIEKVREHYIFTTTHELDDDNKRLKEYIEHLEQKLGIKVCDRCGAKIEKNYWTIDIHEKEDNYGMVSAEGATNNFIENTAKISGIKEEYCVNCIREIKEFIKRKKVKNEKI